MVGERKGGDKDDSSRVCANDLIRLGKKECVKGRE